MSSYHFVGVGGSGMSSLAQVLAARGVRVSGSDRNYDLGINLPLFDWLSSFGIQLYPQDGSGVTPDLEALVVSTAVEESIPDVARARQLAVPVRKRADVLADLLNTSYGIAVAGTSGKSTVTGMIGHILTQAGWDPTVINGGAMKNFPLDGRPNNMRLGSADVIVAEVDESDGSIVNYCPGLAVITNISKDHKDIPELQTLFGIFASQTKEKVVINADCPNSAALNLSPDHVIPFSLKEVSPFKAHHLHLEPFGSTFECQGQLFHLQVPGLHNIYNALAAIATVSHLGIPPASIQEGLDSFQGISRRFDLIGEVICRGEVWSEGETGSQEEGRGEGRARREGGGRGKSIRRIRVIDDFAHNPDKIAATLKAAALLNSRLIVVFQPHGFGPTRFLKDELVESLAKGTSDQDVIFLPEIFYAGGTTTRDISSLDLARAIAARGRDARYGESKDAILKPLVEETRPGDTVVVMGGRDDTLTLFCRKVVQLLEERYAHCAIL
ncbi:MAG: Mur ligase family protein [bacterium]